MINDVLQEIFSKFFGWSEESMDEIIQPYIYSLAQAAALSCSVGYVDLWTSRLVGKWLG
jgi:hypothetical protein